MSRAYYKPKWRIQQPSISKEVLRNNGNLRKFLKIRKTLFMFNLSASAVILAIVFMGVL